MSLNSIQEIIAELKAGRMAVLVDDEDRENEGDLIFAAEFVTAEKINFMAKFGRGLICMPITEGHAERLNLLPMVARNRSVHGTNFTVSIEAASGVTTGISAADRARTIKVAASAKATPRDIVQPGHVFPLIAQAGGVLARAGHTEACCDLAQLAGLTPAAVLCEIMKDDGTMARLPDLLEFSARHGLKIGIDRRSHPAPQPERVAHQARHRAHRCRRVSVRSGSSPTWKSSAARRSSRSCAARFRPERETLVRVHAPLSLLDLLEAGPGTHSWPVDDALERIAAEGSGVMVLLNCAEERGPADRARRLAPTGPSRLHGWTFSPTASARRSCATSGSARCAFSLRPARCPAWRGGTSRSPATWRRPRRRGTLMVEIKPDLSGAGLRVGIVRSRFNEEIGAALLDACRKRLDELRVAAVTVVSVPGSLEAPLALQKLANTEKYDALIALGAVIRGETYHFEVVANESASGLMQVQLDSGIPVANGILTADTEDAGEEARRAKGARLRGGRGGDGEPRQERREEPQMKSARRRSREFALQALYAWQLSGDGAAALQSQLAESKEFGKADSQVFRAPSRGHDRGRARARGPDRAGARSQA